ncbi:MAG: four helix bundle protein, partial [Anaerolineae bacterium]
MKKGQRQYGGARTKTFAKLGGFRNLLAWQRADDLAEVVYRLTGRFGPGLYRLSDQMRGAAISVTGNIKTSPTYDTPPPSPAQALLPGPGRRRPPGGGAGARAPGAGGGG